MRRPSRVSSDCICTAESGTYSGISGSATSTDFSVSPKAEPGTGQLAPRGKTALGRVALSRPVQRAVDDAIITAQTTVFDYGCGRGGDLRRLARIGIRCQGWDPAYRPDGTLVESDVVNLGYVVNVIDDPPERAKAVQRAWSLSRQTLVIAARLTDEARELEAEPWGDGFKTSTGTFQRFYSQNELRLWIERVLGVAAIAAAPGVFYVFKEPAIEQAFLAQRVRRVGVRPRVSRQLFEEHEDLLRELMEFYEQRGRLPRAGELAVAPELAEVFGSPRAALAVVRRLTGDEPWDRVRVARSEDLLVYLALARFGRRPRPSALPDELRLDIRDLFGSHKAACEQADRLLFAIADDDRVRAACSVAPAGKAMPSALYVHVDAVPSLAPVLRVLEGTARALIGEIDEATLVKFHLDGPAISYLSYPDFDSSPHPELVSGYIVKINALRADFRDYSGHANRPILHRKELFLASHDPRRERFARLTRQEERAGLYTDPHRIGTRRAWDALIAEHGLGYKGHVLRRLDRER